MPSLEGPRQKLGRAHEHLKVLEKFVRSYERPKNVSAHLYHQTESGHPLWIVEGKEIRDPFKWGIVAGDAIHNMRASLDHLAWQLACIDHVRPSRDTAFPMVRSVRSQWDSKTTQDRIRQIPESAREVMKGFQPDDGGHASNLLWLLNAIDNAQKHRVIPVAGVAFSKTFPNLLQVARVFDDGHIELTGPIKKDHLKPHFAVHVTFGGDESSIPTIVTFEILSEIHDFVRDEVFPAFDRFFS